MIYDVNTFDDIIKLPIRPQAQFYLRSVTSGFTGRVTASNVLTGDLDITMLSIAPNPNNLRATTLCENGYKVDDPNLRITNSNNYCNLMFLAAPFTSVSQTKRVLYKIQHPFEEVLTTHITIGPIYKGSFQFDWIEYDLDDDSILSIQSATLTATEDYEELVFNTNPVTTSTAYKLMITLLDADGVDCRINFSRPESEEFSTYIITNSNLIQYSSDEHFDLYSQSRGSVEHTVEFLDVGHLYDPQNPSGKYNYLTLGGGFYIFRGYNINGLFVDGTGFYNLARQFYYLTDLPTWENEKVKLHLADGHTFDSNLTTQVPFIGFNTDVTAKKFAPDSGEYATRVLTSMSYMIRFTKGPYSYANEIYMTIDDNSKALMETTGYLNGDNPIEDVYTLVQNALGCWNYGKNVSDISVADVKDYTIDNSVIYDEGMSFRKEPQLKTLTIKKYNNKRSDTLLTYTVTLQASDFNRWSETAARPYRAEVKLDNPLTNIVDARVVSDNPDDWGWNKYYERNLISGLCRYTFYINTTDPNFGAGTYTFRLYPIDTKVEDVSEVVNDEGENLTIDNPFITSDALVTLCATAAKRIAAWREVYEIDVMENFKLRVGDIIKLDTMYETGIPVIITGLQFNIPGPKGHITCRRIG